MCYRQRAVQDESEEEKNHLKTCLMPEEEETLRKLTGTQEQV